MLLAVLLAALAGVLVWRPVLDTRTPAQEPPAAETAAPAPDTAASAPESSIAAHEAAPANEDADPLPPAKPTLSKAREAGLHKMKDGLGLSSSAALVVDQGSGEVLMRKNEDVVLPIASLTKLMTALIVTEAKLPLEETLTITEEDVDNERHSRSRLRVGTSLSRSEALHLALMSSENRAAHALGRYYPGGLSAFVAAMNARARALGMKDTHFVDPTGLSNRNESTARDVALLAAAASRDPLLRHYSTTPQHEVALGARKLRFINSNRLVKNPSWQIHLQKTGYIVEAGQCLTMHTRVGGHDLIMVLLDAGDKRARLADAERIRRVALAEHGEAEPKPVVARKPSAKPSSKPLRKPSGKASKKTSSKASSKG
jgi:D-alanyl-D-alanine endopeptidase (penicillin-binding protein 7)